MAASRGGRPLPTAALGDPPTEVRRKASIELRDSRVTERLEELAARFAAYDGTSLAFRGGGSGPPLILVHGSGSDGRRWAPVLSFLEARFRCFALDRRGHGESGDAASYSLEKEFDDIAALSKSLDSGLIDVVGHSYGALCALGAACMPGVARRLVLYEPPLPFGEGAYFQKGLVAEMRAALARQDPEAAILAFALDVFAMPPEAIAAMRQREGWEALVASAPRMLRELEAVERIAQSPEIFSACRVPTLLLVGAESPPQYHETARALAAILPSARIERLAQQGHGAIDAAPARFAAAALAFLTLNQGN